jgi:uncharacterized protein YgiM (DUF1202 family)
MKMNYWLVLGLMVATSAVAQVNTNALPAIPAPVVVAPVVATPATNVVTPKLKKVTKAAPVKAKKKAAAKSTAKPVVHAAKISAAPVTLVPGVATVDAENVNFRGQAGLKGETVGQFKKGDSVTVLAQINLDKPAAGEPAQWAKVALPAGTKVWVNARFVDATNKVVAVKKLNLRAGPGENYSVLGVIEKGASVTEVSVKGDWTQIETPTNAFAFVAASYLKQDATVIPATTPVAVIPPTAEVPVPTPTTVVAEQPIVTQPAPAVPEPALIVTPVVVPPVVIPEAPVIVDTNPPPPRIVTHEGWVRSSVSVVAPTYFELYDRENNKAINYLYTTTTNLNLARYNGLQIVVTGEEGLDARWKDTPVLSIQKILVLSSNAPSSQVEPAAKKK